MNAFLGLVDIVLPAKQFFFGILVRRTPKYTSISYTCCNGRVVPSCIGLLGPTERPSFPGELAVTNVGRTASIVRSTLAFHSERVARSNPSTFVGRDDHLKDVRIEIRI